MSDRLPIFLGPSAPPPPGSFVRRRMAVTFTKPGDPFKGTKSNTVTLRGLRMACMISHAGGRQQGELDLRVFGMTQSMMNELTFAGPFLQVPDGGGTAITVQAGTDETGLTTVYQGTVSYAMGEYGSAPNVPFHVTATTALDLALIAVPPVSYPGGARADIVMGDLARAASMPFENNGVSGIILHAPYYHGTALDQMQDCAKEAGIEMSVVDGRVAIWPKGGARGGAVPLVSPETGLVGYPTRTPIGVNFVTLFNPAIRPYQTVELKSSLPMCCGRWNINTMDYNLEAETPNGEWFTAATCSTPLDFKPASS
jgi:hypothetical protein